MNYIAVARTGEVRINVAGKGTAPVAAALRTPPPPIRIPAIPPPAQFKQPALFAPAPYRLSVSDRLARAEVLADTVTAGAALLAVTDFQRQVLGAATTAADRSIKVMYSKWRLGLPEDVIARLDKAMGRSTGKEGGVTGFPPSPEKVAWRNAVREAKREGVEERRYSSISARWRQDMESVALAERLGEMYAAHTEKKKMGVPEFQRYVTDHYDGDNVMAASRFKKLRDRLPENIRDTLDVAMNTVAGKMGGARHCGERGLEAILAATAHRPRKVKVPEPPRPVRSRPESEPLYRAMRGFLRAFRKITYHIASIEHGRQLGIERGQRYRLIDQDRVHRAQELAGRWAAEAALDPRKGFMNVHTFQALILQGGETQIVDEPRSLTQTFGLFTRRLRPEQRTLLDAAYFACTGHHLGQTGRIRGQKIVPYRRRSFRRNSDVESIGMPSNEPMSSR